MARSFILYNNEWMNPSAEIKLKSETKIPSIIYTIWYLIYQPISLVIFLIDWCYFLPFCGPWFAAYASIFFTATGQCPFFIYIGSWKAKPPKKQYCINVLIKQERTHPFMLYCKCPESDRWDSSVFNNQFHSLKPMGSRMEEE